MSTTSSPISDPGTGSDSNAKDQAKQTAATASDETKKVAGVASEEARKVASEAKNHARGLLNETMTQVTDQSKTQLGRLAETLKTFSDDLEEMATSGSAPGVATDVARQVADRARSLGSHLDGREPSDLLGDVRRFASQRPGVFLAGSLVAGVLAGRLARGAKAAQSDDSSLETGYAPASLSGTGTLPGAETPVGTSYAAESTVGRSAGTTPTYDATRDSTPASGVPAAPAFLDEPAGTDTAAGGFRP